MDEISKLNILVEQLEICNDFFKDKSIAKYRIIIILLDNITEILLLRCYQPEFESDDFSKWIIPQEYDIKKKAKISKDFDEKINLIDKKYNVSKTTTSILSICHKYRNAIYHRDIHNESTIELIAKLFFLSACNLFQELSAGFHGLSIGISTDHYNWLIKYDYHSNYINFNEATKIISFKLTNQINLTISDAIIILQNDIYRRTNEARELVTKQLPWKTPESINYILKYFEFKERYPQVEDDLSSEYRNLSYKFYNENTNDISIDEKEATEWINIKYLEKEFKDQYFNKINNYKQEIEYSLIEIAEKAASAFTVYNNYADLIKKYYDLDIALSKLEHLLDKAFDEFNRMVQHEIDFRRGK